MTRSTNGFTIIEILFAVMLLSIIIMLVLGSLTGSFSLSRKSTAQVGASNRAQAVIEDIRGQWLNQTAYDTACLNSNTDLNNVTVLLQDENASGASVGGNYSPNTSVDCTSASTVTSTPAVLRAVRVSARLPGGSNSSNNQSELVLEISRP